MDPSAIMKVIRRLIGFSLLSVGTLVTASPFSITYNGIASAPFWTEYALPLQEIQPGPYSVRLVFDNGGTTAASQTWNGSHLTCVIWTFNSGAVRFAQNLTTNPPTSALGSVNTNASGTLTSVFSEVTQAPFASPGYQVSGITLTDPVAWYANSEADVFYADRWRYAVGDSAGVVGINMIPANWSNPTPFNQACSADPPPTAPIPTLAEWAMLLLASLMAMYGYTRLRHRRA